MQKRSKSTSFNSWSSCGTSNKPSNIGNHSENRTAQTRMAPSQDNNIFNTSELTKLSMLKRSYSDRNNRNSTGQSALSVASSKCFLRGIMLLIERGADVNFIDMNDRTPLHLVCGNTRSVEHHNCISNLLEHSSDVNIQGEHRRPALLHRFI